jgi:flagellin
MLSIQTNVASMIAQQNFNVNSAFQTKTIERLTSGYRINSSGDDAAGLEIANSYRSNVSELTQGVQNANDGSSQLQIIDGGLNNISTMLDRMKSLATQSASTTFTGSRATLDAEYQTLLSEINREASNIGLASGGSNLTQWTVYVGGGNTQANSQVSANLTGAQVDSAGLGINSTNINNSQWSIDSAGATTAADLTGNTVFMAGGGSQTFTFTLGSGGSAQTVVATVNGGTNGLTGSQVLTQLNADLNPYGIQAGTDSSGKLTFSTDNTLAVSAATFALTSVTASGQGNSVMTGTATAAQSAVTNGTGNALSALTAIDAAIQALGVVQGTVGAAENDLSYAASLANSQITSYSAAQSQIRDADVASEAANLTKAQVLQQSSLAAMAQANSAPQAVLSLLKNA